jgi:hypothetical protein
MDEHFKAAIMITVQQGVYEYGPNGFFQDLERRIASPPGCLTPIRPGENILRWFLLNHKRFSIVEGTAFFHNEKDVLKAAETALWHPYSPLRILAIIKVNSRPPNSQYLHLVLALKELQ